MAKYCQKLLAGNPRELGKGMELAWLGLVVTEMVTPVVDVEVILMVILMRIQMVSVEARL